MFDAVRNNKRIVQVFLVLIALPFAFFGLDAYVSDGAGQNTVAQVGEMVVHREELDRALHEQRERLRGQFGQVDPALLNTPEMKKAVLDDLINQRLLLQEAAQRRLTVSDDAVRQTIAAIDAFQENGRFSNDRYEALLAAQGLDPARFEAQVRQDIALQQLLGGVGQSTLVSATVADRLLALQVQQRDVQEIRLPLDSYLPKVVLAEGAAQQFYQENSKRFETPEQARAEFVVLTLEGMQVTVTEAEINAWYDSHQARYQQPETRRASHILLSTERHGRAAAREKAEQLLQSLRNKPADFAALARQHSDDPGSASQGGDLGFFGQGMMVKPFEDAVYALKPGELSGIVESDFGFHIIRLTAIKPASTRPLSEVRQEITAELKSAAAARKFAEAAENFSNMVYEQADSLQPVAERYGLKIQQTGWLGKQANPANGPLANPKLLESLFSDDSIRNKRNTQAVEIAPNTLAAARVLEYKPASLRPFDSLRAEIEQLLKRQEALKLAKADGESRLAALKSGTDNESWSAVRKVSRMDPRAIPPMAIQPVFRMPADKLPAYTGVEVPGAGYALYRLSRVTEVNESDKNRRQAALSQLTEFSAREDLRLYLAALRNRYKVTINESALGTSTEK